MATGTFTLEDFTALNDQLAALVEAGVPVVARLDEWHSDPGRALQAINGIISRRVRHGESLSEALEGDEHDLPESYRNLMQLAVRAGNIDTALTGSNRLAESNIESQHAAGSALLYPLVVCGLALVGLIAFCLFFVPTLEGMYDSLRLVPGRGLQILHALRVSLPYWASILAIVALLIGAWCLRAKLRRASANPLAPSGWLSLPGLKEADFQLRCANFAESLADVVGAGETLADGLRLAGEGSGDGTLRDGAAALRAAIAEGQFPRDDSPIALRFPPFLRWALWHSEPTVGRTRALRMAAQIYREAAESRFERVRTVVPLVALVLIGGGATLLYGLTLFVPVVELLRALAS